MSENYSCLPNSTEMAGMTMKFKSRREEGGGYKTNVNYSRQKIPFHCHRTVIKPVAWQTKVETGN